MACFVQWETGNNVLYSILKMHWCQNTYSFFNYTFDYFGTILTALCAFVVSSTCVSYVLFSSDRGWVQKKSHTWGLWRIVSKRLQVVISGWTCYMLIPKLKFEQYYELSNPLKMILSVLHSLVVFYCRTKTKEGNYCPSWSSLLPFWGVMVLWWKTQ